MDTPKLKTKWTSLELENQRQQWQIVAGLSEQISNAAIKSDWQTVLPLAEQRQVLLDRFFQQPICIPLFNTISDQLAAIQQQHAVVAKLIQAAIGENEAKSESLKLQRSLMAQATQTTK